MGKIFRRMSSIHDGIAYGALLQTVRKMPGDDHSVFYVDAAGATGFTDTGHIVVDPEVVQCVSSPWLYKIKITERKD